MINALFTVALIVFSTPSNVTNVAMTLQPELTISFSNTTAKNTLADCVRVAKALTSSHKVAFCGDVEAITPQVASAQ